MCYFDITCDMRVFGRLPFVQASMRAWRFDPLPDIRTQRLCCGGEDIVMCLERQVEDKGIKNELSLFCLEKEFEEAWEASASRGPKTHVGSKGTPRLYAFVIPRGASRGPPVSLDLLTLSHHEHFVLHARILLELATDATSISSQSSSSSSTIALLRLLLALLLAPFDDPSSADQPARLSMPSNRSSYSSC